jgi:hypothetical protein
MRGDVGLPAHLNLEGLFSSGGYRLTFGLRRLRPKDFFANQEETEKLQRRDTLISTAPENFICEPDNEDDIQAVLGFAGLWINHRPLKNFCELGKVWEPDFVLLRRFPALEVVGGCVCFPSGWSLPEKQKHPVWFAHQTVPGLNQGFGSKIDRFLTDLKPAECFQRTNWGLTSSRRLDQHPKNRVPEIKPDCDSTDTFLRVEWQALAGIDASRVLFAIRIYQPSLEEVCRDRQAARLLAENLQTMTDSMLEYKRLRRCRDRLVEILLG